MCLAGATASPRASSLLVGEGGVAPLEGAPAEHAHPGPEERHLHAADAQLRGTCNRGVPPWITGRARDVLRRVKRLRAGCACACACACITRTRQQGALQLQQCDSLRQDGSMAAQCHTCTVCTFRASSGRLTPVLNFEHPDHPRCTWDHVGPNVRGSKNKESMPCVKRSAPCV